MKTNTCRRRERRRGKIRRFHKPRRGRVVVLVVKQDAKEAKKEVAQIASNLKPAKTCHRLLHKAN